MTRSRNSDRGASRKDRRARRCESEWADVLEQWARPELRAKARIRRLVADARNRGLSSDQLAGLVTAWQLERSEDLPGGIHELEEVLLE